MTKAALQNGDAIELLYDADGRKVRETKTVGGTKLETDVVQVGQQVIETYPRDGTTPTSVYVHGRGIDEVVQAELDPTASGTTTSVISAPGRARQRHPSHRPERTGARAVRVRGVREIPDLRSQRRPHCPASAYGWTRLFQGREYIPMLDAYDFRARTLWPELGTLRPGGSGGNRRLHEQVSGPRGTVERGHGSDGAVRCSDPASEIYLAQGRESHCRRGSSSRRLMMGHDSADHGAGSLGDDAQHFDNSLSPKVWRSGEASPQIQTAASPSWCCDRGGSPASCSP